MQKKRTVIYFKFKKNTEIKTVVFTIAKREEIVQHVLHLKTLKPGRYSKGLLST